MMRRITSAAAISVPLVTNTQTRLFTSRYDDAVGTYKRPITYSSRSGAHRRPERRATSTAVPAAAQNESPSHVETAEEESVQQHHSTNAHRNIKNNYSDLFKPRREPVTFKSNFVEENMKVEKREEERPAPVSGMRRPQRGSKEDTAASAVDSIDEDVTKIYSHDEVRDLVRTQQRASSADDTDVLRALDGDADDGEVTTRIYEDVEDLDDEDHTAGSSELKSIREHPFFSDLIRQVERNAMRYRKEISRTGRYSVELVNDCVRPILQLTDFPFTTRHLGELTSAINPITLKSSLTDRRMSKRLQLYRSPDTDLLLDWSQEDFMRRRYESIHLSWECMDVVYRRFGWNPDIISDRDCLIYFSAFLDFIELAELETGAGGKPNAIPIDDPVGRAESAPIPVSRLLIRRRPGAETEPSITESIRLMGTPALQAKGKKSSHRSHAGTDSVSDMFAEVERTAEEVSGSPTAKLSHAMDSVRSLRQAAKPSGRMVKEFSVGRPAATTESASNNNNNNSNERSSVILESRRGGFTSFNEEAYRELSSVYHKTKVEVAMLRRRLLRTENPDQVASLQDKLSRSRKELNRINDDLRRMRDLKRIEQEGGNQGANNGAEEEGDDDDDDVEVGFAVPQEQPRYSEAPEFEQAPKNYRAAEDDDDDIDISEELHEYDAQRLIVPDPRVAVAADTVDGDMDLYAEADEDVEPLPVAAAPPTPAVPKSSPAQPKRAVPMKRSEEIAARCDELSSAADTARTELERVLKEKEEVNARLARRVEGAMEKLSRAEAELEAARTAHQEAVDAEMREHVEAKARAVEEELRIQRERRQSVVDRQREKARAAQLEAQRALERQKEAEAEALEKELELERRLRQVRAELRAVEQGTNAAEEAPEPSPEEVEDVTAAVEEEERTDMPAATASYEAPNATPATPPPREEQKQQQQQQQQQPAAAAPPAGVFMCSPEQYDGLHLAAERLRDEIAFLEKQMEQEGDEDDETLMAVLAASRSDLEELDDCIMSVQQHAPWAAERDAQLEKDKMSRAAGEVTATQRLQKQIDDQRFQISLLEKRLHHTSTRTVISKLEQRIVQSRREISRLRIEQDRLRRTGGDTSGLPSSISMAETLAHEANDDDEAAREAEAALRSTNGADESDDAVDIAAEAAASGTRTDTMHTDEDNEHHLYEPHSNSSSSAPAATQEAPVVAADSDAHRLRQRLDSMLDDIQNLQESITHQERSSDYDDEETEAVLVAMKQKLGQLLKLRDDVQRHLADTTNNATPVAALASSRLRPAVETSRGPVAMGSSPAEIRVPNASKKLRRFARNGRR